MINLKDLDTEVVFSLTTDEYKKLQEKDPNNELLKYFEINPTRQYLTIINLELAEEFGKRFDPENKGLKKDSLINYYISLKEEYERINS